MGVVSSNPESVTTETPPLVGKAIGNHLIASTCLEKTLEP